MTKTPQMDRLSWSTPQLRRIEAGSAEGPATNGKGDKGKGATAVS